MLVISKTKEDNNELHVINRLREKFGDSDTNIVQWFFSILADINCYLPDDWRMTKSNNNFRIQVITPSSNMALVGFGYKRKNSEKIINIIDTVFFKGFFDAIESKQLKTSNKSHINKHVKAKNPELIQPNLYYFQPCPEDSFSPLFARQYERVKYNNKNKLVGTQYHRIHPITKAGLDLEHYKWVKWDINGNIEFVDYPEQDYHGKDYWLVPELEKQQDRAKEESYIEQYEQYIKDYKVEKCQTIKVLPAPYEREYKYIFYGNKDEFYSILKSIKDYIEKENFSVLWDGPKKQVDIYFDDEDFTLYNSKVTFRLRKKKDNSRITLKKSMPVKKENITQGLYSRMEEEVAISKAQEETLLKGERINPFPYRLIAYLAPGCKKLNKSLEVHTIRTTGLITDKLLSKIEICHDIVTYIIDGEEFGPEFEIEIESKGADADLIELLAKELEKEFKLTPSTGTKYERGLSFS